MEISNRNSVECWDDDEDLRGFDDLQFRNISAATATTYVSRTTNHRESISSRHSARSDMEDENDWQLHIPTDDEKSTTRAIADAKSRGIPLPANIPASALLGGTIKRLGGKRVKKVPGDDWGEDLEIPKSNMGLRLRIGDNDSFPETIRQVSAVHDQSSSPTKIYSNGSFAERLQAAGKVSPLLANLDLYRDDGENDDFGDFDTIKVKKQRSTLNTIKLASSSTPQAHEKVADCFEDDFELPEDGQLKLSARKETARTPASQSTDEFDIDWTEGSQASFGTSHGGVKRTGRSNRSSSFSALSPSVFSPSLSSCLTVESEDEGLEGLELPEGPFEFKEALRKRMEAASPEQLESVKIDPLPSQEDFFSGIDIGEGDVFDSGKLTLNRNIKHKSTRQGSPKRTAMTLTFTNKPAAPITRIPKLTAQERPRSKLDTVPESGGAVHTLKRTQSRVGAHSSQSSITGLPTPSGVTYSPSPGPSTPSRRGLVTRSSKEAMKPEPTTTSAQLLKQKRSMPLLHGRNQPSPARNAPLFGRPSSRSDKPIRPGSTRPKTPVDRTDSSLANHRKPPVPFLPAGNAQGTSHHVNTKASKIHHRPTSSDSNTNENAPFGSRSISRLSNPRNRPTTPTNRPNIAPASLAKVAASKSQLTQPKRRRVYGDGSELDLFDDLPTSATTESRYVKQKTSATSKQTSRNNMRTFYAQPNQSAPNVARADTRTDTRADARADTRADTRAETRTPLSPQKADSNHVPRFAQSTTASLARKQRTGAVSPQALRRPAHIENASNNNLSATWKSQHVTPSAAPKPLGTLARSGNKRPPRRQTKPHLIKQLGNISERRTEKGMHYNPELFRWEGNEHALAPFDVPSSPRRMSISTPSTKPALIANVGSTKGVQVVGGMVFDPQRMCWLKLAPNNGGHTRAHSGAVSLTTEEEEEDPFAGFEELKDDVKTQVEVGAGGVKASREAGSDDEWVVGEEFDVGPSFIRRQTNEEAKWKRRLEGWAGVFKKEKRWESRWEIQTLVKGL